MKKASLFILILGFAFALKGFSQSDDEMALIKKQITQLKAQNQQLQKNINALKSASKAQDESITESINSLKGQLQVVNDSLEFYKKVTKGNRHVSFIALKSLRHRKSLAIWGAIIGIVLAGGVLFLLRKKYNNDLKKQGQNLQDGIKNIENELNKVKNEIHSQLDVTKESLEQKVKELEKKIGELKK